MRHAALYAAISIATFGASRVDAAMPAQAPRHTDVPPMTFSREHPSSDLIIWQDEAGLTDESTFDDFSSALVCTSDKSKGDCLTATLERPSASGQFEERVGLTFTEEESGRTIVLTAVGHKLLEAPSFGARYMRLPDLTKTISVFGLDIPARASFGMKIPQSELARIPFGGVWKAALNMRLKTVGRGESTYAWTANIALSVFEDGQIVLSGEPEGDSTIRLNLYPEGKNVSAQTSFEICLSNGFSQFSSEYLLGLRDPHSDDENFYILPPVRIRATGYAMSYRWEKSVGKCHPGRHKS